MRILLLGEFSSLHFNLKHGLQTLGHEVILASSGDGWKRIPNDIDLGTERKGLRGKFFKILKIVKALPKFKGFDIVQIIQPKVFSNSVILNYLVIKFILFFNKKLFLVGAGGATNNSYIADYLQYKHPYKDYYSAIAGDSSILWSQTLVGRKYNKWLNRVISGYIPIMYEYAEGYRQVAYSKLCNTIPIPIDVESVEYGENVFDGKVVFFHGLNNEKQKGTYLIRKAMENLKARFPDLVEVIVEGNMPLSDYMHLLRRVNVVVDQAYSISYGVNALYSMAMGKIVIGGGESECLEEFGLSNSPIIPVKPSVSDIENKLLYVLENRSKIQGLGLESRRYVLRNHSSVIVAEKYIQNWFGENKSCCRE